MRHEVDAFYRWIFEPDTRISFSTVLVYFSQMPPVACAIYITGVVIHFVEPRLVLRYLKGGIKVYIAAGRGHILITVHAWGIMKAPVKWQQGKDLLISLFKDIICRRKNETGIKMDKEY